jgi:hypothetical protein
MDNYPVIDATRNALSKLVLDYSDMHELLVRESKSAGFDKASWRRLESFVDTSRFKRIGTFKEVIDWEQYLRMLSEYASACTWEGTFRRLTEAGDLVYLSLEERIGHPDGRRDVVNTLSVFQFNEKRKLVHLEIYIQSPALALSTMEPDSGFRPV